MKAFLILLVLMSLAAKAQSDKNKQDLTIMDISRGPNDSCAIGISEPTKLAVYWRCDNGIFELNSASLAESLDEEGSGKFVKSSEKVWNKKLEENIFKDAKDIIISSKIVQLKDSTCTFNIKFGSTNYRKCDGKFFESVKGGYRQIQAGAWNTIAEQARTEENTEHETSKNIVDTDTTLEKNNQSSKPNLFDNFEVHRGN